MSDTSQYDPEALVARTKLARLHRPLTEGLERGVEVARDYFGQREVDHHLFAHIVRDHAAQTLAAQADRLAFEITRHSLAGIEIACEGRTCKIWKKHPDGYLPPPGHSRVRRGFLHQPAQLFIDFRGISRWVRPQNNLVYVWDLIEDGVSVWLVCPKDFDQENIWKPTDYHWAIPIDHPAHELSPTVDFAGEEEDLPIHLDEAAGGHDDESR